jgi:putative nucleotidyltransferase with HDIG domain
VTSDELPSTRTSEAREAGSPSAEDFLRDGRTHERAGRNDEAVKCYEAAIEAAQREAKLGTLTESLRRLGVVHHQRNERALARDLCERSFRTAKDLGDRVLAAEALNTLAGFDVEAGSITSAREKFYQALELGKASAELRGRTEQNLGVLANIQGALSEAFTHYKQSLLAFESSGDERGCAIAYHNLGMVSADRELWDDADRYFQQCLEVAERIGDVHLQGLGLLNHAEVHIARQQYEKARSNAERALAIFDRLGARLDKADAYKVIGRVYRETGRNMLAESRLRSAVELAVSTGSLLSEAEASRELALLYQNMGRNQDALRYLNAAHRLFGRLDARVDLVDVSTKVARLEETYFAVVRNWGQSIESSDSYTFGHCERVAAYALAVARELKLDEEQQTTIRIGAYLHDLGKVRVPHEILNKPSALTPEEFRVIQMHPIWGLELLATVEFPWDIKPIIRWHHERYDGSGYPDRLRGDEIPVNAQIICIVDVYDALTTTRSYRPALSHTEALKQIAESRSWWRPDVYQAFLRLGSGSLPGLLSDGAAAA